MMAKKRTAKWPQYAWAPLYANGKIGTAYGLKKHALYFSGFASDRIIKVAIRPAKGAKRDA